MLYVLKSDKSLIIAVKYVLSNDVGISENPIIFTVAD